MFEKIKWFFIGFYRLAIITKFAADLAFMQTCDLLKKTIKQKFKKESEDK